MNYLIDLFSLKGKICVITGAAQGNGKAMGEALLRAGSTVVFVDKLENKLTTTVKKFKSNKLPAHKFTCDLTKENEIHQLIEFVKKKFGKIDILVNNAGVTFSETTLNYPDNFWDHTYKVNLLAPFKLSTGFGKMMKKRKSGIIINITSLNSELAFPDNPAYASFKGALKQLTKSLALDFGKFGIRVNNIGPGYFHTNMTKKSWISTSLKKQRQEKTILGRWGEPKDLAGIVIFLSSKASSYITGQDIYVDGGWTAKGL